MDISYYKKYEPIFGSWHIVREIGEGSFGKVFEIEREDFGYTYKAALKAITIPQNKAEIETVLDDGMDAKSATAYFRGFVEELVEEFRLMSKLKGESNVVSYEDHCVIEHEDGIGWDVLIRMELLTPLLKYTRENSLDKNAVINLGIDICKALELCRKHNIIHRDIKPENIFVSENGKFKLGDFGIAKTVEKTTGGLSKKGTYAYMAPEVYKGEKYGASVDIYSLGIVLYRYLNNNRAPFLPEYPKTIAYTDKTEAISRRIKGEAIPAPANTDKALAEIILKACAYNPKDRYASPSEMRMALESLSAESAVPAPAVKQETINASEAETMREGEANADRTVSVFGVKNIEDTVENSPESENAEIIENKAEAETVCETENETDETVSLFLPENVREVTEKTVNSDTDDEVTTESVEKEESVTSAPELLPEPEVEEQKIKLSENTANVTMPASKNDGKWMIIAAAILSVIAIVAITGSKNKSDIDNTFVPDNDAYVEEGNNYSIVSVEQLTFDNDARIEFGNLQAPYNIGHDGNNIVFCDLGDENGSWYLTCTSHICTTDSNLNEISYCTYHICTTDSYDVMLDIENAMMETGHAVQLCEYTGYEVQNWKFEDVTYENGSTATFIISAEQEYGEFCLALCDGNLVIKPLDYTDPECMWGLSY